MVLLLVLLLLVDLLGVLLLVGRRGRGKVVGCWRVSTQQTG